MTGIPRAPAAKVLSRADAVARFGPDRAFHLVFTNGCFDLLHRGHVEYLDRARRMGHALLVAVNTDDSVRRLNKGADRPFVEERDRAAVVAALESVDAVTLFDEDTPEALVAELHPNVLVKGADYHPREVAGGELVRTWGGIVATVPLLKGRSTTVLADRIRGSDGSSGSD